MGLLQLSRRIYAISFTFTLGFLLPSHAFSSCEESLKSYYAQWPRETQIGTSHVHRQPISPGPKGEARSIVFSVYQPIPGNYEGPIFNLADFSDPKTLPEVILIGDGSIDLPFTLIDRREGSPLRKQIKNFATALRKIAPDDEALLQYLAMNLRELLAGPENWIGPDLKNHLAEFGFITQGKATEAHQEAMKAIKDSSALFERWHSPALGPVVPLEYFLGDLKRMMCFHHSLFASLILMELGIEHELITGYSTSDLSKKTYVGHTWIELSDFRHLDTQWRLLEKPRTAKDGFDQISKSFVRRNRYFPFMDVKTWRNPAKLPYAADGR